MQGFGTCNGLIRRTGNDDYCGLLAEMLLKSPTIVEAHGTITWDETLNLLVTSKILVHTERHTRLVVLTLA